MDKGRGMGQSWQGSAWMGRVSGSWPWSSTRPCRMAWALLLTIQATGSTLSAQESRGVEEGTLVVPGDGTLRADALIPFEAEYEQMGFPFHARLVKAAGTRPVLSFQMVMEGPNGVGIDHVGHYADDLGFAYRRFGFGAFRDEYLEVTEVGEKLVVRRMARTDAPDPGPPHTEVPTGSPVLDGTFLYWALGALPLGAEEGEGAWRFRTWSPTAESVEVRDTPVLRVDGSDLVELDDGSTFEATIIAAQGQTGTFRMWVVDRPPYLLRQEHVAPDGTVTEVIRLLALVSSGGR